MGESSSDIRIIHNGEFVPYIIENNEYKKETNISKSYLGKLVNSYKKEESTFFDFEITIVEDDNVLEDILVNNLILTIENNNFAKNMRFYGSYDGLQWSLVDTKEIFKVKDSQDVSLSIDDSKYTHYRIEILKNIENIKIKEIQLDYIETKITDIKYNSNIELKFSKEEDSENKLTRFTIQNNYKVKLYSFKLDIDSKFHREYRLYNDFGVLIKSGILTHQNNVINLGTYMNYPEFTLEIINKDDKPLSVSNITGDFLVDKLTFKKEETGKYYLFYGNKLAITPEYDLEYINNEIIDKKETKLGDVEVLKIEEIEEPFNYQYILNGLIIIISLSLLLLLLKNLRKET